MIEKLLIASRNPAKVKYYSQVFNGIVGQVVGLDEVDINGKPQETGNTAEENAKIKASYYSSRTSLPVFCEDESLFVDFLSESEQPGTHVRRINGHDDVSDDQLFSYWEDKIMNISEEKRTGRWHIAYCLKQKGQTKTIAIDYEIKFFYPSSKIRIPGWPMSSLEGPLKLGKPHSECTKEEELQVFDKNILKILSKLFK